MGWGKALVLFLKLLFLVILFSGNVYSDSRRVIEYNYDNAGNLVQIDAETSQNPPVITNLNPSAIRIGPAVTITAIGTDVKNAQVTTNNPELTVSNVSSDTTSITFDLQASKNVALGDHTLTFTTTLGSSTTQITIQPPLPVLSISPAPVAVPANGSPLSLSIELSSADIFPHTLNLSTGDANTATVLPATITIPAGETKAPDLIQVTGVGLGTTSLDITSTTLIDFSTTIFVTDLYVPPNGNNTAFAQPLGVILTPEPEPPRLITRGPFPTELSIIKESADVPTPVQITPIVSPNMGLVFGSGITTMTPKTLILDTGPIDLVLTGIGLENATAVEIIPPDDLTLGSLTIDPSGTSVNIPITISAGATLGQRQLRLLAGATVIQPVSAQTTQLFISQDIPKIDSISPVILTRLQTATFVIRGENFQDIESINLTPADGLTIGSLSVNGSGTRITVGLSVAELATLGPRTVTVTTGAGTSDNTASAANTLNIVNGPVESIRPLLAPLLGVQVGDVTPTAPAIGRIRASHLGIAFGSTVTGLAPANEAVGANFTLTIQGNDLQNVTDVQFIPDDGITLGSPVAAGDGQSVTVDVTIDSDAPQTLREVRVLASGTNIPSSTARANRFRVTAVQPVMESVSPINIVRGAGSSNFTIKGQNFSNAQQVILIPPNDIAVGPPVVNGNGTSITVTLSANSSAATGPRVVVVQTPGGQTSSTGDQTNTLNVVNQIVGTITPIVAPLLGIEKQTSGGSSNVDRLITAPLLGINKEQTPPTTSTNVPLNSAHVGVTLGSFARGISPSAIPIDTAADLIVEGVALDNVTSVTIIPDDGLTQTGAPEVSIDGSQITLPIGVDALAPQTLRQIILNTATGTIPFSNAASDRLRITDATPAIISVDPIQEIVDTTFDLIIRGVNLKNVISVDATPADGIVFGAATETTNGTQLTVQTNISAAATPGPRVITVTTVAGTTSSDPTAANTFTVILE